MNQDPTTMLKRFAEQLKELSQLGDLVSPIDLELVEHVSSCLAAYLDGAAPTLDKAFGVHKHRGAQPQNEKRIGMAREVFKYRLSGLSWQAIANHMANTPDGGPDESTLRRAYQDFRTELIAEEISRRLEGRR